MRWAIPITAAFAALLAWGAPAHAQWGDDDDWNAAPVPNIGGVWFLNGDRNAPCRVIQPRPDGRALFVNEHGSRARGEIRGGGVWIPEWSSGNPYDDGLSGRIRGDRIVWPDGSYWSRRGR